MTNNTIINNTITRRKILSHATIAFFITFIIWFNLPPLALEIGISTAEIKKLLLINVALTIPARVLIGFLVDKFGPRIIYTILLIVSGLLAILFTFATTYEWMSFVRFAQGITGAGFVVGIRLISEWYDNERIGLAEGMYGGWGNFGSAAAAVLLPIASGYLGGWQAAMIASGLLAIGYSFIFYNSVADLPNNAPFRASESSFLLPSSTVQDLILNIVMSMLMYLSLNIIVWRLNLSDIFHIIIFAFMIYHIFRIIKNHTPLKVAKFKVSQIGILSFAYYATFGSELTMVSILPIYFYEAFDLSIAQAGLVASSYALMNLFSRAYGGLFSDKYGRKLVLISLLALTGVSYIIMANMSEYGLTLAILITMLASFMVQAGEGSVFASVPLIKGDLTGQISGITGSFGNIGAVSYLTIYSISSFEVVSYTMGIFAILVSFMGYLFFNEPTHERGKCLSKSKTIINIKVSC